VSGITLTTLSKASNARVIWHCESHVVDFRDIICKNSSKFRVPSELGGIWDIERREREEEGVRRGRRRMREGGYRHPHPFP
jgi:hypothetical protein